MFCFEYLISKLSECRRLYSLSPSNFGKRVILMLETRSQQFRHWAAENVPAAKMLRCSAAAKDCGPLTDGGQDDAPIAVEGAVHQLDAPSRTYPTCTRRSVFVHPARSEAIHGFHDPFGTAEFSTGSFSHIPQCRRDRQHRQVTPKRRVKKAPEDAKGFADSPCRDTAVIAIRGLARRASSASFFGNRHESVWRLRCRSK